MDLIYFPLLILLSLGRSAFSGIAQYDPIFIAPEIRPALQRSLIHLAERFHFSAICLIDKYPMKFSNLIQAFSTSNHINCTPDLAENQDVLSSLRLGFRALH